MRSLAILDLPPDASFEDIQLRWKQLAFKHHPDREGVTDSKLFIKYQLAYKEAIARVVMCCLCDDTGKVQVQNGFASISQTCECRLKKKRR